MSHHPYLACQDAVFADFGRARDTGKGCHNSVVPHHYVVGNLAEIVDSHAVSDYGGLHRRLVYGGIRAHFDIVAYDHIAQMFDLPPCTVGLGSISEPVITYDAAGVKYDPVPYHRPREHVYSGIDDAEGAYLATLSYSDIVIDAGAVSDCGILPYGHKIPHGHSLAKLCAPGNAAAPAVTSVGLFLV